MAEWSEWNEIDESFVTLDDTLDDGSWFSEPSKKDYDINLLSHQDENIESLSDLDPNKETFVLTHGWQKDDEEYEPEYSRLVGSSSERSSNSLSEEGYQVLFLDWSEAALDTQLSPPPTGQQSELSL